MNKYILLDRLSCLRSSLNLHLVDVIGRVSEFSNQYFVLFSKFKFSKIVTLKNMYEELSLWPTIKPELNKIVGLGR